MRLRKRVYATILIRWDDAAQSLTIGDRKGRFPGMMETRTFRIVFAREGHGRGVGSSEKRIRIVQYSGKSIYIAP